jgi:ankyrin repeat protein
MSLGGYPLPSAAELDLEKMQDELPEGMALSVMPPAREHWEDPIWYNQAGFDPLRVKKIFKMEAGLEQTAKLKEILDELPKYGPKMYERAADLGRADVIEALLELGAELDIDKVKRKTTDDVEEDDTPMVNMDPALHTAAFKGHLDCIQLLVERGNVLVNLKDDRDSTALTTAAVGGHLEVVKWLLDHGAELTLHREGLNDLQAALKSGSVETVRTIIDSQQAVSSGLRITADDLVYAAWSGDADMVRTVLESGCFPSPSGDGSSLDEKQIELMRDSIMQATAQGSVASLQLLLPYLTQQRPDGSFAFVDIPEPNRFNVFNATEDAMEIKDTPDSFELVWETLLCPYHELEMNQDARERKDDWLSRRLISACTNGCPKTTKLLCEKYDANINHVSHKYFTTPLGRAAGSGAKPLPGRLEVARYLIERGVDMGLANGEYANGDSPLALAISEGPMQKDMVKLLLDFGGPLEEVPEKLGQTMNELAPGATTEIHVVAHKNLPRVPVRLLSKAEYDAEKRDRTIRTTALEVTKEDLMRMIGNMQIRKRDALLAATDPKGRPLQPGST